MKRSKFPVEDRRPSWYVYIVKCRDDSYYSGITPNITRRVKDHNSGKGAKYTRSHLPVKLVYFEEHPARSDAAKREYEIKQLTHAEKAEMVNNFLAE